MRKKGEVEADLAHHWRQIDPLRWRFYLRPAVLWHDGRELTIDAVVIASLTRSGCRCSRTCRPFQATGPLSLEVRWRARITDCRCCSAILMP